jgi:hypothetical protein
MIRDVLIALLCGMLIGSGGVGALAHILIQTNNERLLILETDTHKIANDFDMGIKMVGDVTAAHTDPASQGGSPRSTSRFGDRHKSSHP